jgi:hypothetical protein
LRGLDVNQHRNAPSAAGPARKFIARSTSMMDFVMLAIGVAFFALSIGYVYVCDRL